MSLLLVDEFVRYLAAQPCQEPQREGHPVRLQRGPRLWRHERERQLRETRQTDGDDEDEPPLGILCQLLKELKMLKEKCKDRARTKSLRQHRDDFY